MSLNLSLSLVLLLLLVGGAAPCSAEQNQNHEPPLDKPQNQNQNQAKRRLTLHNIVDIQGCLVSSGDVGCGMFQCFNNNSCEVHGLHHICLTLLHNAGRYDSQGKWFVKEALRCMAVGLRQRFSCVSRRCAAVRDMVFGLQRECYSRHQLCDALRDHVDTMGDLLHFHLLFPPGPYVELVNFLLGCGEEVRSWVGRRLREQCDQQWGAPLCGSFGGGCAAAFNQSHVPALAANNNTNNNSFPTAPHLQPITEQQDATVLQQPTRRDHPERRRGHQTNNNNNNTTTAAPAL